MPLGAERGASGSDRAAFAAALSRFEPAREDTPTPWARGPGRLEKGFRRWGGGAQVSRRWPPTPALCESAFWLSSPNGPTSRPAALFTPSLQRGHARRSLGAPPLVCSGSLTGRLSPADAGHRACGNRGTGRVRPGPRVWAQPRPLSLLWRWACAVPGLQERENLPPGVMPLVPFLEALLPVLSNCQNISRERPQFYRNHVKIPRDTHNF